MIRVRLTRLRKETATAGITTNAALAQLVGVAESTIGRVLAETVEPSTAFIAGLLDAFPDATFDDLFEVVAAPDQK